MVHIVCLIIIKKVLLIFLLINIADSNIDKSLLEAKVKKE